MQLDKLKVQNLNAQELVTTDGGGILDEIFKYLVEKSIEYAIENPTKIPGPNAHTYKLGHVGGGRP